MIKGLYVVLGTLFMVLGLIGVVLPILPTTPLLLLTVYFYAKGSKRFHDWFVSTWLYKRYLGEFVRTKSMTWRGKWRLMLLVDTMLLISFLTINVIALRVLIVVLVIIKYLYFFAILETRKPTKNDGNTAV